MVQAQFTDGPGSVAENLYLSKREKGGFKRRKLSGTMSVHNVEGSNQSSHVSWLGKFIPRKVITAI